MSFSSVAAKADEGRGGDVGGGVWRIRVARSNGEGAQ